MRPCYYFRMPMYSDEARIAALVSELMLQSGTSADAVESRLGWEPGRLNALLAEQKGLSFEALLEILPVLDSTPGDFFAQLYAFHPRMVMATATARAMRRRPRLRSRERTASSRRAGVW